MNNVSYIYRLSLDGTNPTRILATCKLENDEITTYSIDIRQETCEELIADGDHA